METSSKRILIKKPQGGGSSINDLNIKDDLLYVSKGIYGNRKVTLVIFNNSDLEYCFDGIIDFVNEEDVINTILNLDKKSFKKIIKTIETIQYDKGFKDGKDYIQHSIKNILNIY